MSNSGISHNALALNISFDYEIGSQIWRKYMFQDVLTELDVKLCFRRKL